MGQLNVTVDDAMLAGIDRLAAERSVNRQELVRALVREAMDARSGIAAQPPLRGTADPAGLAELVGELRQLSVDLDRSMRDQDRREARLQRRDQRRGEDGRHSQRALIEQFQRKLDEGLAPLRANMIAVREQLQTGSAARNVPTAESDDLADIRNTLERLAIGIQEARPQVTYQFGKDWAFDLWTLFGWSGVIVIVGLSLLVGIARIAPDSIIAVPLARGMFGSAERAECVLDGGEFYAEECHRYPSHGGSR